GERQIVEIAQRLGRGADPSELTDIRGTAHRRRGSVPGYVELDSEQLDTPGAFSAPPNPYQDPESLQRSPSQAAPTLVPLGRKPRGALPRERSVVRLPSHDAVSRDKLLY